MESFLEILLLAFVSTEASFWHPELPGLAFSNVLGHLFKVAYLALPIVLVLYVARMVTHWDNPEFHERNGTLLEGLNVNWVGQKRGVLFMPIMYFIRRIIFAVTVVYWQTFFWGMIACQFAISTTMMIFLQWSEPLESKFATNMETFNEFTTLNVLYLVMCFSDFVGDAITRNKMGFVFIGILSFNVLVHMVNLVVRTILQFRLRIRRAWHAFWVKEALEL